MSKTVLYALVNLLVALLMGSGVEVPEDVQQLLGSAAEHLGALLLALNGVVVWWLRMRTDKPMAGLLIKRKQ